MSLDYIYEHLDEVVDRSNNFIKEIDPKKTALLVLDMQKLIADKNGAAYVPSVAGAPAGDDTIVPCKRVIDACRKAGIRVFWSLWGLRGDGADAGIAKTKWPAFNCGTPESPASWGNRDAELVDELQPLDNEPQIYKHRFSTFYNTPFDDYLREYAADTLIIVGITTANCMISTARDGWDRNYKVIVVADSATSLPHSGKDQPMGTGQHWEALRNMQMNYADVLLSEEVVDMIEKASA